MTEPEQTLADSPGRFVQVIEDGRKVADVTWIGGRLLLSTRRLVLASEEGKRTIALSTVAGLTIREADGASSGRGPAYISCQAGADVFLLGPADFASFRDALFGAILDQQTVLVKHPVVKGGVVQDASWVSGKLTVDDDEIDLALSSGTFVAIDVDDVATVAEATREVDGTERRVLEIEHTEEETSVETHVTGSAQATSVLATYTRRGESTDAVDVELTTAQREVLTALYTGVSPFEVHDFVGMDVERVEAVFDGLMEEGILERVRTRREVTLQARGRSIASQAMTNQ